MKFEKFAASFVLTCGLLASTLAHAGLMYKDQAYFDRLKSNRQSRVSVELHSKNSNRSNTSKSKILQLKQKVQKMKVKKIIGTLKSIPPDQFKRIFKVEKPDDFSS